MKRRTKILLGGGAFGVIVATSIWGLTGSAQIGLHGAFWMSLVFMMWLDVRVAE